MSKPGSIFGGTLLIAGTSIGGGVLALPVLTGFGGFFPSVMLYFVVWAFMVCTGLLYLEVIHWMDGEPNIISMATKTLGKTGMVFAWFIYLFFFYCLTIAYVVGCGNLITEVFSIPDSYASILFVLLFAPFLLGGARLVGKANGFLMFGLGLSYFGFVFAGYRFVNLEFLMHQDWSKSLMGLPIIFAAFGYQGTIPTLSSYMHRDIKKTQKAIIFGSLIPFISYVVWQWLILGIVPVQGQHGLMETLEQGQNAVHPLKYFTNNPNVYLFGQCFAFFALTTSFFGVTLGLMDFLADGLNVKKNGKGKFLLLALVFVPPLLVALVNPHVFLAALDLAGGVGSALLLCLLPILMVWSGRYILKLPKQEILDGGKPALCFLAAFVLFELSFELYRIIQAL